MTQETSTNGPSAIPVARRGKTISLEFLQIGITRGNRKGPAAA